MTPLHLRRRLRAVVTILAGAAPDDAAEARAAYRVAYDCGDDEPVADLMRHVLDEVAYQKRAHADTLSAHYRVVGELDGIRAGLCTDGDTRDALRHVSAVLDDAGVSIPNCDRGQGCTSYHLTHRIHALADERDKLRAVAAAMEEERLRSALRPAPGTRLRGLNGTPDAVVVAPKSAAADALDAIAAACGCAEWEYPGQVVRDVEAVVRERDEAVALISTLRAQNQGYAAELAEVDQILGRALGYPTMGPEVGGDHTTVCTGEHTPASLAGEAASRIMVLEARERGEKAPERKRTKEERWEQRKRSLDGQWTCTDPDHPVAAVRLAVAALGRDFHTSRTIAEMAKPEEFGWTDLARDEAQRLVPELARAGYLTVAKGPGGVRVYGLKEGA